jgi:hypothetical protein
MERGGVERLEVDGQSVSIGFHGEKSVQGGAGEVDCKWGVGNSGAGAVRRMRLGLWREIGRAVGKWSGSVASRGWRGR